MGTLPPLLGLANMRGTWKLWTPCELTLNTRNGVVKLMIIRLNFNKTFVTWSSKVGGIGINKPTSLSIVP